MSGTPSPLSKGSVMEHYHNSDFPDVDPVTGDEAETFQPDEEE